MTQDTASRIRAALTNAYPAWPSPSIVGRGSIATQLEARLVTVVGNRGIQFCVASEKAKPGEAATSYSAAVFTPDLVAYGEVSEAENQNNGRVPGDVFVASRRGITSLVLHDIEDRQNSGGHLYMTFSADYAGLGRIRVDGINGPSGNQSTEIYAALLNDLLAAQG